MKQAPEYFPDSFKIGIEKEVRGPFWGLFLGAGGGQ